MAQCALLRDSVRDAQIQVAGTMIADCTDGGEVSREIIDEALDSLAANIERNDAEYAAYISQGVPRNEPEVLDMLQDFYEQAVYEIGKRFDGPGGIYPEPNSEEA